jgi:hypothetical protein
MSQKYRRYLKANLFLIKFEISRHLRQSPSPSKQILSSAQQLACVPSSQGALQQSLPWQVLIPHAREPRQSEEVAHTPSPTPHGNAGEQQSDGEDAGSHAARSKVAKYKHHGLFAHVDGSASGQLALNWCRRN